MFKHAAMEEERVKVVDEIDALVRTLNLTSSVAVTNGQAVASTNAARLFAKLEHIHGDIKFTHDQIHAALLADRQQIELIRTKKMPEPEPLVKQIKCAPILKKCASVVIAVEKEDTLTKVEKNSTVETTQLPKTISQNVTEVNRSATCDEEEQKAPITAKLELEQNTADVVVGSTMPVHEKIELAEFKQTTPENVMESTFYEAEEKALVLELTTNFMISSTLPEVENVELAKLNQNVTDGEAAMDEWKSVVAEEQEEFKSALVENRIHEVVRKESVNQTSQLQQIDSSTVKDSSVPLLIQLLGSNQATAQQKEEALLRLLRRCINNSNRVQVYKANGIPVLTNLVRNSESFFTQLYALHCLSWFTFSYSKMRESEFVELQSCVRQPTHPEILSLLHELQYVDEKVKSPHEGFLVSKTNISSLCSCCEKWWKWFPRRTRQIRPTISCWLNALLVVLLVINCWSILAMEQFLQHKQVLERVVALSADAFICIAMSVIVPVAIMTPYSLQFDVANHAFKQDTRSALSLNIRTWKANLCLLVALWTLD